MNVIVLGGYGVFGTKLCELLCKDGHEVWIAGRNLDRATKLANNLKAKSLYVDRNKDLSSMSKVGASVIIDASGPFQSYGAKPYRVAEFCIENGMNYIDLSDSAEFTNGITQLDIRAKQKGCYVLSGASSVPAVSAAVVTELSQKLDHISSIETAILPGNTAPRGYSVIKSILSQVGLPQKSWRGEKWRIDNSWSDKQSYTFTNGEKRSAKTISVPDMVLFPDHFKAQSVTFRAGQELRLLNWAVDAIAVLNRFRKKPPPNWIIKLCHLCALPTKPFGTDEGGMFVKVIGQNNEGLVQKIWQLWATHGHGPYMPVVTPRALLKRTTIPSGARPCISDVTLTDLRDALQDLKITEAADTAKYKPLFETALGSVFHQLPQTVQLLHSQVEYASFSGLASVSRGNNWLSHFIANLFGFPKAGTEISVNVDMKCTEQQEIWRRTFDGKSFHSVLTLSRPNHFKERFGPMTFEMELPIVNNSITMPVRKGWFLGVPMPRFLLPKSETREYEENGLFHFDVALSAPICGLLARYRGRLVKDIEKSA